jgi:hypothetical protein
MRPALVNQLVFIVYTFRLLQPFLLFTRADHRVQSLSKACMLSRLPKPRLPIDRTHASHSILLGKASQGT